MRKPKVHLIPPAGGAPICGATGKDLQVTHDQLKTTCKNCLRLVGNKTTEQGGPKLVNVVVSNIGPSKIDFVKALRQCSTFINVEAKRECLPEAFRVNGFGLKEAVEFANSIATSDQFLLTGIDQQTAVKFKAHLEAVGAKVQIENPEGKVVEQPKTKVNPLEVYHQVTSITKAYREMLRLFVPDEEHLRMLGDFDEYAIWPLAGKHPTVKDVRRWLDAGGITNV